MSEEIENDVTDDVAENEESIENEELSDDNESDQEEAINPAKHVETNDKAALERIKYLSRQVKASDSRNKMYFDMLEKQQAMLDDLMSKSQNAEAANAESNLMQKLVEAREEGDLTRETKILNELVEFRVQQKLQSETKKEQPVKKEQKISPDVQYMVELMNETDSSGAPMRPWMNDQHPRFAEAEKYADMIEARLIEEKGEFDMQEAMMILDKMMNEPAKKPLQAKKITLDPMSAGGNLTNTKQNVKLKLSPQEESIARKLGLTNDEYLNGKRRYGNK